MFFLLAGCMSEKPAVVPLEVTSDATPEITLPITPEITPNGTALATLPTPVLTPDCTRGDFLDKIESSGRVRQFLLHVPATYQPEEPAALVMVFHGAGIAAERFVSYSRFSNVADREGFLVVYPQGLGDRPVWNPSPGSPDVQFVSNLIDHLEARCNIDPDRIYASGHSNGGGMVNRLACELTDRIAAVAPISGAYSSSEQCTPSRPIPIFSIHGADDPIVPYDGIPEWASGWAQRNGCNPEPAEIVRNVLIREMKWSDCLAGADVVLYTMEGIGHNWPSDLIEVGQTMWDFFDAHPMRGGTSR